MATGPGALTLKRDTTTQLPLIQSAPQFRQTRRREALNPEAQRRDAVTKTRKAEAEVRTPAAESRPRPHEAAPQQTAAAQTAQTGKKIDVFA